MLGEFAKLPGGFEEIDPGRLVATLEHLAGVGSGLTPAALFCGDACRVVLLRSHPELAYTLADGARALEFSGMGALPSGPTDRVRFELIGWAARAGHRERAAVGDILAAIDAGDIRAAADVLADHQGALSKSRAVLSAVSLAAAADPAGALEAFLPGGTLAPGTLGSATRSEVLRALYSGWAATDAGAALAHARESGHLGEKEVWLASDLAAQLLVQDVEAGVEFLRAVESGEAALPASEARSVLRQAVHSLAKSDPDRALTFAMEEIANPEWRQNALREAVDALAARDPRDAIALLDSGVFTPDDASNLVRRIGWRWGEADRAAAVEWALSLDGEEGRQAMAGAFTNVGRDELTRWVRQFLEAGDTQRASAAVRGQLGRGVTSGLLELDPPLPPDLRRLVVASELATEAERNPAAVPDLLAQLDQVGGDYSLVQNVQGAITRWAASDPVAAARWAESTTLGDDVRNDAFYNVVNAWARHDGNVASEWLARQPESPARDAGAVALAERIVLHDPDAALAWVAGVSDARQRASFFRDHTGTLNRLAPDATRALVDEGVFGDRAKGRLDEDAAWREALGELAAGLGE